MFRILDTYSLTLRMGKDYVDVPLRTINKNKILDQSPEKYSGDILLRSLRNVRGFEEPLWSIMSEEPLAVNLLLASLELKIK